MVLVEQGTCRAAFTSLSRGYKRSQRDEVDDDAPLLGTIFPGSSLASALQRLAKVLKVKVTELLE
jgi:hypothetical protein